jgi:hypothetical protein
VFSLREVDTDYIQSEHQPLNNRRLLSLIAAKLHFNLHFVTDPAKVEKKIVVNKESRNITDVCLRSTVLIERHFLGFAPSYTVAFRR